MYNFELVEGEEVIKIFDDIYIWQDENEKTTSIILTNKRVLFLDYVVLNDGEELLRIARGINYLNKKDVYYQINLCDIERVIKEDFYKVVLNDNLSFAFDNEELYLLINELL